MVRLVLIVLIIAMIYSFVRAKREFEKKQAEIDAVNEKKDKVRDERGIVERVSAQDKYAKVFMLSEDNKVYVYDSEKDKMEEIKGIKSIETKRRYATAKAG